MFLFVFYKNEIDLSWLQSQLTFFVGPLVVCKLGFLAKEENSMLFGIGANHCKAAAVL